MADSPSRRSFEAAADETGWGSPMPAEYGSLTASLPPLQEVTPLDEPVGERPRTRNRSRRDPAAAPRRRATTTNGAGALQPDSGGYESIPPAPADPNGAAPPSTDRARRRREAAGPGPTPGASPSVTAAVAGGAATGGATRARRTGTTRIVPATVPPGIAVPPSAVPTGTGPSVRPARRAAAIPGAPPMTPRQRRKAARTQWAQTEHTVRHVNIWSVAKVSLVFYLLLLVSVVVASVMLWYVANAFGAIHSIEKSVKTLFDLSKFTLHPQAVATYTSIGGGILALAGTLANILIACTYNLISDLVGGLRFKVVEDAR